MTINIYMTQLHYNYNFKKPPSSDPPQKSPIFLTPSPPTFADANLMNPSLKLL